MLVVQSPAQPTTTASSCTGQPRHVCRACGLHSAAALGSTPARLHGPRGLAHGHGATKSGPHANGAAWGDGLRAGAGNGPAIACAGRPLTSKLTHTDRRPRRAPPSRSESRVGIQGRLERRHGNATLPLCSPRLAQHASWVGQFSGGAPYPMTIEERVHSVMNRVDMRCAPPYALSTAQFPWCGRGLSR